MAYDPNIVERAQKMAYAEAISGQTLQAGSAAVSVFDRLDRSLGFALEARSRAMHLADQLVGPVPQPPVGMDTAIGAPSAVFTSVGTSAERLERIASDIMEALNRIERALP